MATFYQRLTERLESLPVKERISVDSTVEEFWGFCDYFTKRSFDVYYCKSKAFLKEKRMEFKRKGGFIYRVK